MWGIKKETFLTFVNKKPKVISKNWNYDRKAWDEASMNCTVKNAENDICIRDRNRLEDNAK